jgi:hypothetical protein
LSKTNNDSQIISKEGQLISKFNSASEITSWSKFKVCTSHNKKEDQVVSNISEVGKQITKSIWHKKLQP